MLSRAVKLFGLLLLVFPFGGVSSAVEQPPVTPKLKLLFYGDLKAGHAPQARFRQLQPVLEAHGIDVEFSSTMDSITAANLAKYDGLIIYTNTTKITPQQEKDLLDYVEGGKGFIPLHCSSYAFQNSPKYIALVGAQFKSHGTGVFKTTLVEPEHPIMKGFKGFESWDETYVHAKHNEKDRTVLEYREDGKVKEPWTWVRTQGKGRVFYTAWGHDQRTWSNPGFQDLVERGIRWAVGQNVVATPQAAYDRPFAVPATTTLEQNLKPFEYKDVGNQIPDYKNSKGGKKGATLNMQQLPVRPEESVKHMVVPKGFHVELVAADPEIYRPICMNWDERGRLWIAETLDYPHDMQNSNDGKGRDRLVICEDSTGSGKIDKFTVFAEKLSIPAGFAFYNGGVIVFEGKKTVFLKDTTGGDKSDFRKEMFGTWAQPDTHGGVSNMRYGLDNWIWAMQGYNNSTVNVGGEVHKFGSGFFRFKPDGTKLEFLRSTNNNTWGLGISEEGLIFGSTANANPSTYMAIPNRYYESVRGWKVAGLQQNGIAGNPLFHPITDKVRQVDQFGKYTAAAGHSIYTARTYPQEYWNRIGFVSEPTGHLVGSFVLQRDGAQFKSTNPFNLVASNDEWTSPILAEVGPDGNVWVIDWYSFIVQHNPTPPGFPTGKGAAYKTELRSTKFGRIYRIVPDNFKAPPQKMTLKDATPEKLVATLKNDNMFWRLHAQRLLVQSGSKDVIPALIKLVQDPSVDEVSLNCGAIHALWTLHGLGALNNADDAAAAAAFTALRHASPGVRRNAAQVLPKSPKSITAILQAGLLDDSDGLVRLAGMLALADQPPTKVAVGKAVVDVLAKFGKIGQPIEENKDQGFKGGAKKGQPMTDEKLMIDASTAAAAMHSEEFLTALATQKKASNKLLQTANIVAEHYARGRPVDSIRNVVAKLADAEPEIADPVVRGIAKGWPSGSQPKLDPEFEKDLARLAARLPSQGALVQLASAWGSKQFEKAIAEVAVALMAKVTNEKLKDEDRLGAARELVEHTAKDKKTIDALLELVNPRSSPELAAGILQVLQASDMADVGQRIADQMPTLTPAVRKTGISVLLARPEWTIIYLDRVEKGKLLLSELSLDQKQALIAHPKGEIRKVAVALMKTGGALPNPDRQKAIDELVSVTKEKGDPVAGKLVFTSTCTKCHSHSGEGQNIGPDLTGMAVHSKEHLLMEIIDPSRSVEGNFRVWTVITAKGLVLNGLLAAESKTAIELYDAEGKKQVILRADIESLTESKKSLMPDGFEKQLNKKQITDLLEFLTQRGKYITLPLDRIATVVSTKGMFGGEEIKGETLILKDWKLKTVEGVPFLLVDPQGEKVPNVVLLYSPQGKVPPKMPKTVSLPVNTSVKAIHLLSGVSGWGYPYSEKGTVSMIVRLHYEGGAIEDHPLKNGEHFADYIRREEVPGSKFAFNLGGKQMRYLSIQPKSEAKIERIEFVKGPDATAPVVMAVTVEPLH